MFDRSVAIDQNVGNMPRARKPAKSVPYFNSSPEGRLRGSELRRLETVGHNFVDDHRLPCRHITQSFQVLPCEH